MKWTDTWLDSLFTELTYSALTQIRPMQPPLPEAQLDW